MRVIAGSARGRPLKAPPGAGTRPTSDRVREALFSALGDTVPGASVLDLYAGSGALAVEALSRGAARAVLVERERLAAQTIAGNLERAGVADRATLLRMAVERYCADPVGGPFALVLADPPYAEPLPAVYRLLDRLHRNAALQEGAVVVVERDRRDPALDDPPPDSLAFDRRRSYGDTVLTYLRAGAP